MSAHTGDELARVQAAWDSIPSLPPLDFTAFEARDLMAALKAPTTEPNPEAEMVREAEKLTAAIDLIGKFQWRDGDEKSAAVAMRHIARTAAGTLTSASNLSREDKTE